MIAQTRFAMIIAQAEGGEDKRNFMQKLKNITLVYLLQNGGIEN